LWQFINRKEEADMADYLSPEWQHAALLTIDVQRDFTLPGAPAEIAGTMEVVSHIQRLVAAFRQAHKPIIHVVRLYRPDGSNVDLCRRAAIEQGKPVVLVGSPGAELVDALKPSPHVQLDAEVLLAGKLQPLGEQEWALYKPRWGAFYGTCLDSHLSALDISTLVFCGCNFPNCPRTSLYEASERDFRLVFIQDATSGVYDRGVQELQGIGISVMTTHACLAWARYPTWHGREKKPSR
jgi:nicotinamidase-related amidase